MSSSEAEKVMSAKEVIMYRGIVAFLILILAAESAAKDNITINMLANNPSTRICFHQMVKANKLPTWVVRNAENYPTIDMTIRKDRYYVMKACNPDNCEHEQIAVIYSPQRNIISGVYSITDRPEQQSLQWLGISDEQADWKALLFAALSGSLIRQREFVSEMNVIPLTTGK
ncbi:Ivy family c-type lysozyme inhibitor [Enterobacter sp. RD4-1-1]|uniref:Ivy family c-type lysozyme inhibitor n=1 Tax=Enterobacter sp. RD4-1-1 TaxID=2986135 RepID=UPI0021E775FA|nr:Ivy family c-type lysozyme inhibitor [Enterobacter sp. RD4-1-1]MCV3773713.1 Ivy family c-type lysozyme inhibitor [Enterobacter sp. RD4-1-1]